jgi:subfamily B ATP-binding cassette protein MsbA
MSLFTAVSIPAIIPFLQILFNEAPQVTEKPVVTNVKTAIDYAQYLFSNSLQINGQSTTLIYICVVIVVLYFLINVFRYLSLFFMVPVLNGIVRDIRNELFSKITVLPLSYFSEEKKGDLLSRMTADVAEIQWSILMAVEAIFREPIIIILCLATMIYISPSLTLFVFFLLIFTTVIIGGIGKTLKRQSSLAQQKLGSLISILEESLSGLRIIQGFNAEEYQKKKFETENNNYRNLLVSVFRRRDLSSPLSEFLGITVVSILLWYASLQVFAGSLEPTTLFAYLLAFFYIINPAKSFSNAYYNVQKGIAATERIEAILDAEVTITEAPDAIPIDNLENSIEYRNLSFSYKNDEKRVLKNINLHIKKGKVIALVGPSGGGKSTLVDLLPRFIDPVKGAIFIDGIDIKTYKLKDLRSLMGIVSQEAILFNDSIYNNIVFGMKDISEADVINAAKVANAHDFIMETENGYQTNIGDRGSKLSGGQRQRMTIARAVLKNPPIMILDEATSALDSESEKLVQDALIKLMENRTSIVIAHRLSTIQHADEIVVIENGEIIERGTHHDLMENGGAYRKLVALQAF